MPKGEGTYGSQVGRPRKKKAEGSLLLGQEQRTVDKRIEATIQDELDYLNKYGEEYWNSGTAESSPLGFGLFSGAAQSLGASGRGQRALNQLQTINNQMKGGYSDEDLWNKFNDELINTFPENDDYRLAMDLIDREGNYGGGRIKKAEGGSLLLNDEEREGYIRGGLSRLSAALSKRLSKLFKDDQKIKQLDKNIKNQEQYIKNKGWEKEREEYGAFLDEHLTKNEQMELTPKFSRETLEDLKLSRENRLRDLNEEIEVGKAERAAEDSWYERIEGPAEGPPKQRGKSGRTQLTDSDEQKLIKHYQEANKRNFPDRDAQLSESELNPSYDPEDMAKQIKESYNELIKGKAEFEDGFFITDAYGTDGWMEYKTVDKILKKRTKKAEGGEIEDQMNALAISVEPVAIEEQQLPDEEMEADYVDYVVDETLSTEDQDYLDSALAKDTRLSGIFDQVVESAAEFSGAGPIEGPGSEVSDSIPARLSDGEFVFTAKAVDEIGTDVLQQQMESAESRVDKRQSVAYGGEIGEDEQQQALLGATEGIGEVRGNIPSVLPLRATEEELQKSMLQSSPRQYYRPTSG